MSEAIVVCRDLMTASRLTAEGVVVTRCSSADAALSAARTAEPGTPVFVDVTAFATVPGLLRAGDGLPSLHVIAFAPHVQEELLQQAREHADLVLPRGAVVKRFAALASKRREGDA